MADEPDKAQRLPLESRLALFGADVVCMMHEGELGGFEGFEDLVGLAESRGLIARLPSNYFELAPGVATVREQGIG